MNKNVIHFILFLLAINIFLKIRTKFLLDEAGLIEMLLDEAIDAGGRHAAANIDVLELRHRPEHLVIQIHLHVLKANF